MTDFFTRKWQSRIANILIGSLMKRAERAIVARVVDLAAEAASKAAAGTSKDEIVRTIMDAMNSSNYSRGATEGSFVKSEYVETTPVQRSARKPKGTSLPKNERQNPEISTPDRRKENTTLKLMRFLSLNFAFRYNVITRQTEVKFPDESDYIVMGHTELCTLTLEAHANNIECWDKDIRRIVESRKTKRFHPFKDYMENTPEWDGIDRVTPFVKLVSENPVWVKYAPVWMRGMVAQWIGDQRMALHANCVIPVIITTEQGWGKSTFCRMVMPPELRYLFCENISLNGKNLEMKLAEHGLINIDEFDRLSARHMTTLKNLSQQSIINTTLKYHSSVSNLQRIASFIATTNRRDILTDGTGSRRFLCVEPERPIDCTAAIDYRQLYAQLRHELEAGLPIYFDKEAERKIQESNRAYRQISPAEEALRMHFNVVDKDTPGAQLLTALQIYNILKKREKYVMRDVSCAKISRLLPGLGKSVHTMYCNGYYVVVS